jgi:hypothetical protein
MDSLARDLAIGIAGAVIGAVLLNFFSFGFRWGKESRAARQRHRDEEIADWKSGDAAKRQKIFNHYLFAVLRVFMLGNVLIGVGNVIGDLNAGKPETLGGLDYFIAMIDVVGVVFYIATFAKIMQFTALLKRHP